MHLKMNKTWMGAIALALPMLASCGQLSNYKTRTAVLSSISDAEWAAAAANPVVLNFGSTADDNNYEFRDGRNVKGSGFPLGYNLKYTFQAGKPYVLHIINRVEPGATGTNPKKSNNEHYLSDETTDKGIWQNTTVPGNQKAGVGWSSNGFWSSIVVQKVVDKDIVFKAPFILDLELNDVFDNGGVTHTGGTSNGEVGLHAGANVGTTGNTSTTAGHGANTEALVYFVPVRTGSFKMWCSKPHSDMLMTINIVGEVDRQPDFELESDFDQTLAESVDRGNTDCSKSGSNASTDYACRTFDGVSDPNYHAWKRFTNGIGAGGSGSGSVTDDQKTGNLGVGFQNGEIALSTKYSAYGVDNYTNTVSAPATWAMSSSSYPTMTTANERRGYQFRLYKLRDDSKEYEISSEVFKNVAFRKIHSVHTQFKPVYLESITLREGLGTDCGVDAPNVFSCKSMGSNGVNDRFNGRGNPGEKQVDIYMVPQLAKKGSFDTTIRTGETSLNTSWIVE